MNLQRRLWAFAAIGAVATALWFVSSRRNISPPPISKSQTAGRIEDARSLPRQMSDRLLTLMRAEADPENRRIAAQNGAQNIPRALLPAVLAELKNEPDRALATEAASALLLRWAWEEPTGAAAWAVQSATGEIQRDALAAVGAGWARQNPEALMTWSASLPPADRDWVLLHGASYLARTDPGLFAVWLKALTPSRELTQLSAQAAREWAARDPKAVAAAIRENTQPELSTWRKDLASGLANQLSLVDKCETAFAILDTLPAGPEKQQVLRGTVIGWSRRDPVVVATWLDGVSDPALRTEMSALLAGAWFERDAAAAEKWAAALPPGPASDAVAERAAQYFAPRDRQVAERWAARIATAETRTATYSYVQAAQPLHATP